MILLATDNNLEMLASADTVFMVPFKIAPQQFTQLFTLHIIYMGFFIHVVYALLKDKSAETYYQMFATLRRKLAALNLIFNPTSQMIDFETGILPTLAQHFPNSTVKGCNFHFCQAVWRKVQNLGLVPHYKTGTARRIVKSDAASLHSTNLGTTDLHNHYPDGQR